MEFPALTLHSSTLCKPGRRDAQWRATPSRQRTFLYVLVLLAATSGPAASSEATAPSPGVAIESAGAQADADFFEQNAHQPGVILLPGGDQARLLSAGEGASAEGASVVVLNLSRRPLRDAASVPNATAAQHTQRYQTQTLPRPIYETLQKMHVGDRWEVYARAHPGKKLRIPGHKPEPSLPAAIFTVELIAAN
jgi:hypothetical protein